MYSLGEVETISKKAAKASGMTWGEAVEAGYAIRNLARFNLPNVEAFVPLFQELASGKLLRPSILNEIGPSDGIEKIGFFLGLLILDTRVSDLQFKSENLEIKNVRFPLSLLGTLLSLVLNDAEIEISWKDFELMASAKSVIVEGRNFNPESVDYVRVKASYSKVKQLVKFRNRVFVNKSNWMLLENLAFQTYVPDSEVSRKTGAGSGNQIDD